MAYFKSIAERIARPSFLTHLMNNILSGTVVLAFELAAVTGIGGSHPTLPPETTDVSYHQRFQAADLAWMTSHGTELTMIGDHTVAISGRAPVIGSPHPGDGFAGARFVTNQGISYFIRIEMNEDEAAVLHGPIVDQIHEGDFLTIEVDPRCDVVIAFGDFKEIESVCTPRQNVEDNEPISGSSGTPEQVAADLWVQVASYEGADANANAAGRRNFVAQIGFEAQIVQSDEYRAMCPGFVTVIARPNDEAIALEFARRTLFDIYPADKPKIVDLSRKAKPIKNCE